MNLFMKIFGTYDGKAALDAAKTDVKELDAATDKAAKGGVAGLSKGLGDMAKIAGGVALGSAIQQAPAWLFDAAKGAAADEQATNRLNKSLENLATATGGSATDLAKWKKEVDQAIAAGGKLAFTDDEVRDSYQGLLAATGSHEEALKRQKAAMDLARGANIPLATATKMLGKLNEENVEVFKKLGITLGDTATEADAFAAVQAKFGGQAEEFAQGAAGQFAVTQIQMAELKESIGTALLPVMGALGVLLATVIVPAISNGLVPGIQAVAAVMGFLVDHATLLMPLFIGIGVALATIMLPAVVAMVPVLWAKAAAWLAVAAATIAANAPLILIALGIGLVVAAVVLLIQHWGDITAKFPILGQAADAVKATLQSFVNWITGDFVAGTKGAIDSFGGAFEAAKLVIELHIKAIVTIIEVQIAIIKGIFEIFSALLRGDFSAAWQAFKDMVSSVWTSIGGLISTGIETIKGLAPLMLAAGKAIGEGFLEGLKNALSATAGFAGDVGEAILKAVKGAVNGVIDQVNAALYIKFDTHIPGVGTVTLDAPDIPHLARGGITNGPTLAVIGDNPGGREAVIPLPPGMNHSALGGSGMTFVIYALDGDSVRRVIPTIVREIANHQRRTGVA